MNTQQQTQEVTGVMTAPLTFQSFTVPQQSKWMKIQLSLSEKAWMMFLLTDPSGTVRLQGFVIDDQKEFIVSTDYTTSSYSSVPGMIQTGEWKIELMKLSKQDVSFTLLCDCGNDELPALHHYKLTNFSGLQDNGGFVLNDWNPYEVRSTKAKWYKGDFHTHTYLSDGKLSPEEGMESARNMELDFFVATDHNILPTKWLEDRILVIPGIEVTSSKGHFNALGLSSWVDWRYSSPDGGMESEQGMNRILKEVKEKGAIRSINHPMLAPWDWTFHETELSQMDVIEIWNDPTFPDNRRATEEALVLWDTLLSDGFVIYGIGGSDSHMRPTETYEEGGLPSLIGDPATYVWAEELSAHAILSSVLKGNAYVTRGPVLNPIFTFEGERVHLGEVITNGEQPVETIFELSYEACGIGSYLVRVFDGTRTKVTVLGDQGHFTDSVHWKEGYHYLRYEIRSQSDELLAFINPIFIGQKETSLRVWKDLLEKAGYQRD